MSINRAEQAVAYAALILADESIPITPEKLETLLKAAGVEDVEPIWSIIFAKALEGKDVKNILTEVVASRPVVGGTTQNGNEKDDAVPDCDKGKEGDDAEGGQNDDDDDDSVIGMSLFD